MVASGEEPTAREAAHLSARLAAWREALAGSGEGGLSAFLIGPQAGGSALASWIAPDLAELIELAFAELSATLGVSRDAQVAPAAAGSAAGAAALALCALDGRIEPRRLAGWLAQRGLSLEAALVETLAKAHKAEAAGARDAALLAQLALTRALAAAAGRIAHEPGREAAPVVAFGLLDRAARVAAHAAAGPLGASDRLRATLLLSPLALQRSVEPLVASELNVYRTDGAALRAARAHLRGDHDLRDPEAATGLIARDLSSDPEALERCWIEAAMEELRACLAEPFLSAELPPTLAVAFTAALCEPRMLHRFIAERLEREVLLSLLARASPAGPWAAAHELLIVASAALAGRKPDQPLPPIVPGLQAEELPVRWAQGAYLLAADAAALRLFKPTEESLRELRGEPAEAAYQNGRCLRLGPGPTPILGKTAARPEGHLVIDFSGMLSRARRAWPSLLGRLIRDELHGPALRRGGPRAHRRRDALAPHRRGFCGRFSRRREGARYAGRRRAAPARQGSRAPGGGSAGAARSAAARAPARGRRGKSAAGSTARCARGAHPRGPGWRGRRGPRRAGGGGAGRGRLLACAARRAAGHAGRGRVHLAGASPRSSWSSRTQRWARW